MPRGEAVDSAAAQEASPIGVILDLAGRHAARIVVDRQRVHGPAGVFALSSWPAGGPTMRIVLGAAISVSTNSF